MSNTTMEYNGYLALIELDEDGDCFHGRVVNTKDVINFYGRTASELRAEFHKSVDEYLGFCRERGVAPDKPYSGKVLLRLRPDIHRELAIEAARERKSFNALVSEKLERVVAELREAAYA